ncbi:MAG TPA: hypothetical protein VFM54_22985 [Micromonosporaceae bacterium]|nr:hypothetical protein [Micromonosporaceae bacterium]
MPEQWWSIEVLDGPFSASVWYDAHGSSLVEAALSNGAGDWAVHRHHWGLVFEVSFPDLDRWSVFRHLPAVSAALDAVPDPINGLLIYPGRGGSAGAGDRRRPRPHLGAGAAPLPESPEPVAPHRTRPDEYAEPLGVTVQP